MRMHNRVQAMPLLQSPRLPTATPTECQYTAPRARLSLSADTPALLVTRLGPQTPQLARVVPTPSRPCGCPLLLSVPPWSAPSTHRLLDKAAQLRAQSSAPPSPETTQGTGLGRAGRSPWTETLQRGQLSGLVGSIRFQQHFNEIIP